MAQPGVDKYPAAVTTLGRLLRLLFLLLLSSSTAIAAPAAPAASDVEVLQAGTLDERGLVLNRWAVAPGDPAGRYEIRVFVDDLLVRTFVFEVERQ